MSELAVVVADQIWSVQRSVWFSGVRLRVRTTILRLDDGSLLIHSPAPPTPAMIAELAALGAVRWLVVPNCFHHLGTPAAAAQFLGAQVVAPASARERNQELRIDVDIAAFSIPELDVLPLAGVPFLDETLLYHRPTQTLLGADIVLSACAQDHWTWRWAARVMGCWERVRVPPDVKKKVADKAAAARSIQAILDRPVQRLIVGHADVIEGDCRERLAEAWRSVGVEL